MRSSQDLHFSFLVHPQRSIWCILGRRWLHILVVSTDQSIRLSAMEKHFHAMSLISELSQSNCPFKHFIYICSVYAQTSCWKILLVTLCPLICIWDGHEGRIETIGFNFPWTRWNFPARKSQCIFNLALVDKLMVCLSLSWWPCIHPYDTFNLDYFEVRYICSIRSNSNFVVSFGKGLVQSYCRFNCRISSQWDGWWISCKSIRNNRWR